MLRKIKKLKKSVKQTVNFQIVYNMFPRKKNKTNTENMMMTTG
jgi:hypothetical protein